MSDLTPAERQIQRFLKRLHREKEQLRLFRRFRFQPTRAESELAMLPPLTFSFELGSMNQKVSKTEVEYEAAEEIYRQMLKSFEGNHNPTQPNVLCGLYNLGVVLIIYGKLEEAEKPLLRILEEIGGRLRPEDDLTLALTLNNLAGVKWLQGKYQEAEMLLHRALDGREQALDDSDKDFFTVLECCNNLALTLWRQNKAKEARNLQQRVVEKFCEVYDLRNPYFDPYQRNLEWIQG
jgi:tetratricopeptide (TPR) repeat protein